MKLAVQIVLDVYFTFDVRIWNWFAYNVLSKRNYVLGTD